MQEQPVLQELEQGLVEPVLQELLVLLELKVQQGPQELEPQQVVQEALELQEQEALLAQAL